MKKNTIILSIVLLFFINTLSGCFELSGLPDYDSHEDEEIQDWVETIENRVYVTVTTYAYLYSSKSRIDDQPVLLEITVTDGTPYSVYGYTDEYGSTEFEQKVCVLDRQGDTITVKATAVNYGDYDADSIDYDTAKSYSYYDEKNGYTYAWGLYLFLDI